MKCFLAALMSLCSVACADDHVRDSALFPPYPKGWLSESVTKTIRVQGPMVVGFFPVHSYEGLEEHFVFAIEDTAQCLTHKNIPVQVVYADTLIIENGAVRDKLILNQDSPEGMGCYFVAPEREPNVVNAIMGGSSLRYGCMGAAAAYFDEPACNP
jgi:hypothetical protein